MGQSDPGFRSFHALRIKGFASSELVSEVAAVPLDEVEAHLSDLKAKELAMYREQRNMWSLTPAGREAHLAALEADAPDDVRNALEEHYPTFLGLNDSFKTLCGDWQLVNGDADRPNDHSDAAYDGAVVDRLVVLHRATEPVLDQFKSAHDRLEPYQPRLNAALGRVQSGEHKQFTGVMCSSYHDVWMELHEDLILTLRIDRTKEGSF